ncbi:MAG: hypothetical protein LBU70_10470 [Chitinispirillales bacterium]|jgi:hypothetical protein|nr:hypothetical protein [Chitinispirillales bacterium]
MRSLCVLTVAVFVTIASLFIGYAATDDAETRLLADQILGEWVYEDIKSHPGHKEAYAITRKVFLFQPDGSAYLVESRKGRYNLPLIEDWEFRTWGTYDTRGDTIMFAVNRLAAVRQNFWTLDRAKGRWVEQSQAPFDTLITDGSQDRFITFSDLIRDFRKVEG